MAVLPLMLLVASILVALIAPEYVRAQKAGDKLMLVVSSVHDGDTLKGVVQGTSASVTVRLGEIDAPELTQPHGVQSRDALRLLVSGDVVSVECQAIDRYRRVVGLVTASDGTPVNKMMLAFGCAWHYKQYSKSDQLSVTEAEARRIGFGLWSAELPEAPWDYRRRQRTRPKPTP